MKVEFVNPFLQATINVISTMAMITPKPGKPRLKEGNLSRGDVTGIIGLTGPAEGSLAVSFSASCALKIVENMLGEKHTELNDEVADAVGELTNMISGDARAQLQKVGFEFTAAIPTVVRGKDHIVKHISKGGPTVLIPFSTDDGDFYIEASFSS
ncbi:MAG: chemotaxis protein CheX [bacterium]